MIVAIDGPAGVGKSTVAACIAQRTGFLWINSGAFYRLITKMVLDLGKNPQESPEVVATAASCQFELRGKLLYLNGARASTDIHNDRIDRWVAIHSSIPQVREIVNQQLRGLGQSRDLVVEGRDIGTVVFPKADLKVFLDAALPIRSLRRFRQGVSKLDKKTVMSRLRERDYVDTHKPVGRLEKATDAWHLDTSDLTIDQVCDRVLAEILKFVGQTGSND